MQLTIAFDDVSLPLPPMRGPDARQLVIEQVLDLAAEAGVDDVVLICALALHRRLTDAELRHAVGDRIYDAFAPHGLLQQHDAEDPDKLVHLGLTDQGEDVEINKRAATSDLLVYVNINLVAMDGGHKSVATGLASYQSLRHHHNAHTMQQSRSFMDQHRSELHSSNWRMGRLIADSGVKVFQIETNLNTDTFPPQFRFLQRREWEWSARDRAGFLATSTALARTARARGPIDLPFRALALQDHARSRPARSKPCTPAPRRTSTPSSCSTVEGQTDILTLGLPYICPYNVNSIMNPILVACLGLGYFFNMYRGRPLVREGGVVIMSHPTPWAFHPGHHPSYIDFFEQVLAETTDPAEIGKYEEAYATDPWYVHLYRTGQRLSRRPPLLHVVLVRPRPRARGRGHHRGRGPGRGAPPGFKPATHHGRRPGDGHRRGGPRSRRSPTCTPRRCSWPTCRERRRRVVRRARRWRPEGFPWSPPDVARGRRARRAGRTLGRRLRHRMVAALSGPPGAGRPARQRDPPAGPRRRRRPRCGGTEMLELVEAPAIFVANHASHVDTGLLLSILPRRFRHKTVVAAAADHFFDRRWKAHLWSLGPRRHPHRAAQGQPASRPRTPRRCWTRGGTSSSSPRAAGPTTGGSRSCTAGAAYLATPHGPARGARPHRRHLPDPGPRAAHRLRRSPTARSPSAPPSCAAEGENARALRGPDRDVARHHGRRGPHRLVDGPPPRRVRADTVTRGPAASPWRRAWALGPDPHAARRGRRDPLGAGRDRLTRPGSVERTPALGQAHLHRGPSCGAPTCRARVACRQPRAPTASSRCARKARSSTSSSGAGTDPVAHARSRSARLGLRARTGPCA